MPVALCNGYPTPYTTTRFSASQIASNFAAYSVMPDLARAAQKTTFETYNGMISSAPNNTEIAAHDAGHVSIGATMADQNVAAFDPIFWLYHCNLDRLYWEWQQGMQATDLNGLLSTITSTQSRNIFTIPVLESLAPMAVAPYNLSTISTVDSISSLDVAYAAPTTSGNIPANATMAVETKGKTSASKKFFMKTDKVNVRVKGVNRLKIPGSFKVHLLKDNKVVASRAFFQPIEAHKCANCVENAVVHFDFELSINEAGGGQFGIWVEPLDHSLFGDHFPHKLMGNPTINARLLMTTE